MNARRLALLAVVALGLTALLASDGREPSSHTPASDARERESGGQPSLATAGRPQPEGKADAPSPDAEEVAAPTPALVVGDERPKGRIAGVVLSALGQPMGGVEVEVMRGERLVAWFTDEWGRFDIRVDAPGTYTARARVSGLFDGVVEETVTTDADAVATGVRLVFPAERSVSGVALLPDGEPAAHVLLKITTVNNRMGLGRFAESLWSSAGSRSWLGCRTNERGEFGFGSIDPRSVYAIWWMGNDGALVRHPEDVRAGQNDLRIEVRRRRVVLDVIYGEPGVTMTSDYESRIFAPNAPAKESDDLDKPLNEGSAWDEPGHIAPAGTRLRVVVFHCGHTFADRTHVVKNTWGDQVVRVTLNDLPACANLETEARDPEGRVVPEMWMPVSYVDEDGSEVMRLGLTLIGENGEWGTWIPPCRLRVRTAWPNDATSWNDKRLLLLPASQTFEMPRSGTKRVVLEMTRGGMAELVFKEPRTRGAYQGYYFLEYELRDDRGEVVPVGWYAGGPWDRNVILDTPPHVSTLTTDGAKRTTALPAGRYTLKLWASFAGHELESMTVPLSIVQGKVTKHVVQLVHEPRTRR